MKKLGASMSAFLVGCFSKVFAFGEVQSEYGVRRVETYGSTPHKIIGAGEFLMACITIFIGMITIIDFWKVKKEEKPKTLRILMLMYEIIFTLFMIMILVLRKSMRAIVMPVTFIILVLWGIILMVTYLKTPKENQPANMKGHFIALGIASMIEILLIIAEYVCDLIDK